MSSELMRKFIDIVNEKAREDNPNISYETGVDPQYQTEYIIAHLKSHDSAKYTKLAKNLQDIENLTKEIEKLKAEVKNDTKDLIADLFDAEDEVRTRIVKTVSFTFTLSKTPKATVSPKYKDILSVIEKDLTPELKTKLTELKNTMVTVTQKSPSLRLEKNVSEGISDKIKGAWESVKSFLSRFKESILSWGKKYDQKLDNLISQSGIESA